MQTPRRLFDLLEFQLEHCPQAGALSQKIDQKWLTYSTAELVKSVNELAWGLHFWGICKGDRVANVTENNRVEWNLIDGALTSLGAIHLPIYPNISVQDYEFILNDSGARLAFVSSERLFRIISSLRPRLKKLEAIYTYDPVKGGTHWLELKTAGEASLRDPVSKATLDHIKKQVRPDDCATLIYTSGTTGNPKGVMLSHSNLISNCMACAPLIESGPHERALSFLPLCHIYERTVINIYVYLGTSVSYAQSLETIGEDLREVQPNVFSTVPRLLEKIYERIVERGSKLRGFKRAFFYWALKLASGFEPDRPLDLPRALKLAIADFFVFSLWRAALGGRIRGIVSGSASLQPRLARIFWAAGMPVCEGYGPTEASPVIAVNHLAKGCHKIGTVGPVIPGGIVKIAEDGEILYRGPNVMMGYYHQPELTAETVDSEGWLHTGDVGEFDGIFLKITDRKKEIFKTSGGKYIAPQQIENLMKESPYISQIMVVGENRRFPAALVVPAFKKLIEHFERMDVHPGSNAEIAASDEANALIESEIQRLNRRLGHFAQIKKFVLLPKDWSISGGDLTPTLKLKRKQLLRKYENEIESLYSAEKCSGPEIGVQRMTHLPGPTSNMPEKNRV
ncbi:MAG TPA: AMP-dependent synthetase/ligase [Chthoniobacterales bacterium]|nr:AMP-dependent synthetase/ligase [Chthoniobacterales bacterium]